MLSRLVANRGVWLARLFAHKWVTRTKERMPSYALVLAFYLSHSHASTVMAGEKRTSALYSLLVYFIKYPSVTSPSIEKSGFIRRPGNTGKVGRCVTLIRIQGSLWSIVSLFKPRKALCVPSHCTLAVQAAAERFQKKKV